MPLAAHEPAGVADSISHPANPADFRVELVGAAPPPYGGVSVFCARLLEHLTAHGIPARLWDTGGSGIDNGRIVPYNAGRFSEALSDPVPAVVHWHRIPDRRAIWRSLFTQSQRQNSHPKAPSNVFTFLNTRVRSQFAAAPIWKRMLLRRFWRSCEATVFMNEKALEQGVAIGCPPDRCHVIPAFIPPGEEEMDSAHLLPSVREFIASHQPVLAAGGWTIDFHQGVDMYGLDLLVEMMGQIVADESNIGLIYCLPHPAHRDYFERLQERARSLRVDQNILWITEPLPSVVALWKAADLMIRPTCTDGDALSIREALHAGAPVVSSDVVKRPAGCRTFTNRDLDSLVAAVRRSLIDLESPDPNRPPREGITTNFGDELIELYRSVVGIGRR